MATSPFWISTLYMDQKSSNVAMSFDSILYFSIYSQKKNVCQDMYKYAGLITEFLKMGAT